MRPTYAATTVSPVADHGRHLRRLIGELGVPHGIERSCKLFQGRLERDRFLLTLSLSAFGPAPYARLFRLLADMAMPDGLVPAVRAAALGADLVHFGHEGTAAGAIAKVYFEYPRDVPLVYRAFKWRRGGASANETHYTRVDLSRLVRASPITMSQAHGEEVARVLAVLIDERVGSDGLVGQCMRRVLSYPAVRRAAPDLMLLDVVDTTSPRRSIDLNIYAADLVVGSAYRLLEGLGEGFAIAPREIDALAAVLAPERLGHVAGGTDPAGAPFVTLYYGARSG